MREEINNWWKQSQKDLEVAKYNFKGGEYYASAFFCQQSVEKGLKAYIILTNKESPGPIHSLIKLGRMAKLPQKFHKTLKELTSEYYLSRYPDASEEAPYTLYNKEEAKELINKTEKIIEWLDTQIKKQKKK